MEFGKNKRRPDGLACYCKTCKNEYGKKYREGNREKIREGGRKSSRKYYKANSEAANERSRRWSKNNKERHTPWEYNPNTGKGMIGEMEPLDDEKWTSLDEEV